MQISFFVQLALDIVNFLISKDFSLDIFIVQMNVIYRQLCEKFDYTPFSPEQWNAWVSIARMFLTRIASIV